MHLILREGAIVRFLLITEEGLLLINDMGPTSVHRHESSLYYEVAASKLAGGDFALSGISLSSAYGRMEGLSRL